MNTKTIIRFKNKDDFQSNKNAKDFDYDSEEVTFTGYVYKLNPPQVSVVKRSAYAKGTISMQENVEYYGQNCCILTSGMCSIKRFNYFTKKIKWKTFRISIEPNEDEQML